MFNWLLRLFSGPAPAAQAAPAAAAPLPAEPAEPGVQDAPPAQAAAPDAQALPAVPSFDQLDRVNNAWDGWLFGRTGDGLETSEAETKVLADVDAIIGARQSGVALVRRMPGLVPQLLQSLRSDQFSGAALSRTISSDVVLVAEVIRLANAACQGTGATINSVEHAVILIGQEGLRQLITTVAFRPIIDMHSGAWTRALAPRLWEHAERCALGCRALAAQAGVDPLEAFLAGLVHNAGLVVALRVMDQVAPDGRGLGSEVFCAQLARAARTLTCVIAREWDFAPAVTRALGEQGAVRKGVQSSALGRALTLADYEGKAAVLNR